MFREHLPIVDTMSTLGESNMSNEVVTFAAKPSYLAVVQPVAVDEFSNGLGGGGLNMPVLSIRGKEFRVRMDKQEQPVGRDLDVILVAGRPNVSKRYFEKGYDPKDEESQSPTCYSHDGIVPNAQNPKAHKCAECPFNAWGSAVGSKGEAKKGKACGDFKRLVVLPVFDNGVELPALILDLPPTSFKSNGNDMKLKEYVQACAKNGIDPTTYVVTLSFTSDEFPSISFRPKRYATEAEYARVVAARESDDVKDALAVSAPPAAPAFAQPALAPAPAFAQPAAAPAPVVPAFTVTPAPAPVASAPVVPAPAPVAPALVVPAPAPVASAPVETAQAPVSNNAAEQLAKVQALLSGMNKK